MNMYMYVCVSILIRTLYIYIYIRVSPVADEGGVIGVQYESTSANTGGNSI